MIQPPPDHVIADAVRRALAEDLGEVGDITGNSTIAAGAMGRGEIVARRSGVVAGMPLVSASFGAVDDTIIVETRLADGAEVGHGEVMAVVSGPARGILAAERTALNFLGHLSGIATATRRFVEAVAGTGARIADTRKTTPGLRALEKYAVRCGGGANHRFGLHDAVLIKDNHLIVAGGVAAAVQAARSEVGHTVTVEVEVETLDQVKEAVAAGADMILLDNMGEDLLRQAVILVDGRARTEASGGVTLENVRSIAATGVDLVSVGWVTHSAPRLDVALEFGSAGSFGTPCRELAAHRDDQALEGGSLPQLRIGQPPQPGVVGG